MPEEVPVNPPANRFLAAARLLPFELLAVLTGAVWLWIALIVPSAARTNVSINGNNITITVPIDGIGIDRRTAREWKESAESVWNDAFVSDDNPYKGCFKLKLVLDVEHHDYSYPAQDGRHLIFATQGVTRNQAAGAIARSGNPYQSSADGNFDETWGDGAHGKHIAHEVGHLLALPDEYTVVSTSPRKTKPLPGRENTLMADGGRIDAVLLKRLVDRLRIETHNIPDCRKPTGDNADAPSQGQDGGPDRGGGRRQGRACEDLIIRGVNVGKWCP